MNLKHLKSRFYQQLLKFDKNETQSIFKELCAAYLNLAPIDIILNESIEISKDDQIKFDLATEKLLDNEPIQYILGRSYFFGLEFVVNPSVLIPRPETEELVAWILEHFNPADTIHILDLGTGSGCIAITLAKHLPKAKVYALDISVQALEVAKQNAINNNVQVEFLHDDMTQTEALDFSFDVIVSNPPYVRHQEKSLMKSNVLNYEPHLALFVEDENPLKFYESIREIAAKYLTPGGFSFVEINEAFGPEMTQLFNQNPFEKTTLKHDTFGKPRMLKTKKK